MSDPFNPPPEPARQSAAQDSWKAAAAEFIDSRVELIRLEARSAGQEFAQRAALVAIVVGCAALVWLLLLAGLIGWIASLQDAVPWYGLTLIAALIHLIVAVAAVAKLRQPGATTFPLTRTEFAKDRAWLESLKNDPPKPKR
ncbi:MAG: phage holin family protein [Haloferula sp.]